MKLSKFINAKKLSNSSKSIPKEPEKTIIIKGSFNLGKKLRRKSILMNRNNDY